MFPDFSERLKDLDERGLLRVIRDRGSAQGARIRLEGRELVNFASNDYLGLAGHPLIIEAAKAALEEFGFGSGASRLLGGGNLLHSKLEEEVARFKGAEAALVFNSGYAANTGIIPSLAGEGDAIFSDELNHASIVDGCRLSRAKTLIYRHNDTVHLEELLGRERSSSATYRGLQLIVTDTVFSMDGDIAPLAEIRRIAARFDAVLYTDDAHATGVIGEGRGGLAHFGLSPDKDIIQMGTFSKALGSYGAFVAGSRDVISWIANRARSFIFSTALPACAVAASLKALELLEESPSLLRRLRGNCLRFAQAMKRAGIETTENGTPIFPLVVRTIDDALSLSRHLYNNGVYVPAVRPPTVKAPRLRITITAAHSDEDIDSLVEALISFRSLRCQAP